MYQSITITRRQPICHHTTATNVLFIPLSLIWEAMVAMQGIGKRVVTPPPPSLTHTRPRPKALTLILGLVPLILSLNLNQQP